MSCDDWHLHTMRQNGVEESDLIISLTNFSCLWLIEFPNDFCLDVETNDNKKLYT